MSGRLWKRTKNLHQSVKFYMVLLRLEGTPDSQMEQTSDGMPSPVRALRQLPRPRAKARVKKDTHVLPCICLIFVCDRQPRAVFIRGLSDEYETALEDLLACDTRAPLLKQTACRASSRNTDRIPGARISPILGITSCTRISISTSCMIGYQCHDVIYRNTIHCCYTVQFQRINILLDTEWYISYTWSKLVVIQTQVTAEVSQKNYATFNMYGMK
jgi:hypothetical protein